MAVKHDYYKLMGVRPIDGEAKIKSAYKELVKKFHPDLNVDEKKKSEEKMRELTEAYNVLINREKRKEYDQSPWFRPKVPACLKIASGNSTGLFIPDFPKKKKSFIDKIKGLFTDDKSNASGAGSLGKNEADRFAMGLTYLAKHEESLLEMAKIEFNAILEAVPGFPEALFNLAIIEYLLGNFTQATTLLKKAKNSFSRDADLLKLIEILSDE